MTLPILSLCGLTLLTACASPQKQIVVKPTEIFLTQDLIRACPRTDRPALSDTPLALMSKDDLEREIKVVMAYSVALEGDLAICERRKDSAVVQVLRNNASAAQ